jgi:hypothetical protein
MSSNLAELSFENLVRFYSEELRMIEQGEEVANVLTPHVRKRLREEGILFYRNKQWVISEKAIEIISTN